MVAPILPLRYILFHHQTTTDVKRQNDALVKAVNYYQGVIEKLVRKNEKEDLELRWQYQGIPYQAVRWSIAWMGNNADAVKW